MDAIRKRMEELRRLIEYHNNRYYNLDDRKSAIMNMTSLYWN